MKTYGYARVSTREQNLDSQLYALEKYGCDKIYTDIQSGRHTKRNELDKLIRRMSKGDEPSDKNELVKATDDFYYELQQDIGMEAPLNYYKNMELTDSLPKFIETKASDISVENLLSGADVTSQFDVAVSAEGKVSIKAKAAALKVVGFYGQTYRFKIKAHVQKDVVLENKWDETLKKYVFKNKANIKIDSQEKTSNEATTLVPPAEILINKIDVKTKDVLEGAEYSVRDKGDKEVAKATTGKDGKAFIEGLAAGTYTVKETKPPIGFESDAPDQPVTIINVVGDESVKSITFANTLKEPKPSLKKEASVELITLDKTFDYTLTVSTNKDAGVWFNGIVSDVVPKGLTIVSVTDVETKKEIAWDKETNTIKWDLAKETAAGKTRHATVKVKVTGSPEADNQFVNIVTATGENKHGDTVKPNDATIAVNYKGGKIGFKDAPEKMSFNESFLSMYPSTIERQKVDWSVDIEDTRAHKEPWRVTVQQITPFETTDGDILPQVLTFRQEGKDDQTVDTTNSVEIYNETKLEETDYKLSWPKKEGFFLIVQPGKAKDKQYETELQWSIEDAPL